MPVETGMMEGISCTYWKAAEAFRSDGQESPEATEDSPSCMLMTVSGKGRNRRPDKTRCPEETLPTEMVPCDEQKSMGYLFKKQNFSPKLSMRIYDILKQYGVCW